MMYAQTNQMLTRHAVLVAILVSVTLLLIATSIYPGGTISDKNSIGFDWTRNFFSNLFAAKALNGTENPSRIWALTGMVFHSLSTAIFFVNMSRKIPIASAAKTIKYLGIANIVPTFLIVTPLHDIMIIISSTLFLMGLFYIAVFMLKTKLQMLKLFCIVCLLTFYYTLYLYGAGNWGLLAIMQKVSLVCSMLLILALEYFTKRENFERVKLKEQFATNR